MIGNFNALVLLPQNILKQNCFMRYFTYLNFLLTGPFSQIVFPLKEHFSTALSMFC